MDDIPNHMSAVLLTGHGGFECLEYRRDVPVPTPGPGEVLVRVEAAAVNNTDINTRIGWYSKAVGGGTTRGVADTADRAADATWGGGPMSLPRIQGIDACGRIVGLGDGVPATRRDERVLVEPCLRDTRATTPVRPRYLGSECDGAFAQYLTVPSVHAHRVDSTLSSVELASFPCSYSTAENMLTRAGVTAGETVLVTGASGGVGSAAVQLARRRGARVLALARPAKHAAVCSLGADEVLDRDTVIDEALGTDSVDVVIDVVGGPGWGRLLSVLVPGGRYAVSGAIAGALVELDLRTLYLKDLRMFGCTALDDGVFAALVRHIEAGEVRPVVAATYPLSDIVQAQKDFLAKAHTGKLVLVPPQ